MRVALRDFAAEDDRVVLLVNFLCTHIAKYADHDEKKQEHDDEDECRGRTRLERIR